MTPRLDRYGDELEDDDTTETAATRPARRERKGRPIGGLAAAVADLGGKCPKCDLFVCGCCRYCGGRTRPGWSAHPSCERAAALANPSTSKDNP